MEPCLWSEGSPVPPIPGFARARLIVTRFVQFLMRCVDIGDVLLRALDLGYVQNAGHLDDHTAREDSDDRHDQHDFH